MLPDCCALVVKTEVGLGLPPEVITVFFSVKILGESLVSVLCAERGSRTLPHGLFSFSEFLSHLVKVEGHPVRSAACLRIYRN